MTETLATSQPPRTAANGGSRDAVLLAAFTIFSGAMGAVLHLVLDVEPANAALAALCCLSILVAINAVSRRATTVASLNSEIAGLRAELANLRSRSHVPGYAARPPHQGMATIRPGAARGSNGSAALPGGPPPGAPVPGVGSMPKAPPLPHAPLRSVAREAAAPVTTSMASEPEAPPMPVVGDLRPGSEAMPTTPSQTAEAEMTPYWAVRPGVHREPRVVAVGPTNGFAPSGPLPMMELGPAPGAAPVRSAASDAPAPSVIETRTPDEVGPQQAALTTDAGAVDLAPPGQAADEPAGTITNPATAPVHATAIAPSQWPKAAPATGSPPLDLGTMQNLIEQLAVQLNQPKTDDDKEDATQQAAQSSEAEPAQRRAPVWQAPVPAISPASVRRPIASVSQAPLGRLALIAEAVEADRMDVYLDPILGLADRKARHFELSVRLLTTEGDEFEADDYMGPAAGTGLLARIDQAKLARAAGVAQRLKVRGSRASLFSNIAGESLADEGFIGAFADILDAEEGLGAKLVLTFTQADARAFTAAHWEAISAMSEIGLKFALEDVRDLDMDFSLLRWHGFDFIKLEAEVFLDGLPTPTGHIPAADICRHLSELGLGLIVGGIVEEKDLGKILGFGALLGQGALFGAPRSVQLDVERRAA